MLTIAHDFFVLIHIIIFFFQFQFSQLSTLYQIVLISVYIVMTLVEVIRLYIGYVGNLMEKVIASDSDADFNNNSRIRGKVSVCSETANIYPVLNL